MNDQRLSVLILAAVGMATAFMPWVKMPLLGYVPGTDNGGWLTFVLFGVVFILTFIGERSRNLIGLKLYSAIFLSLVAAGIGVWKIIDLDSPLVTVEYGLYLMTLTGVVIPLAAFIIGKSKKRDTTQKDSSDYSYKTEVEKKGAPD